MTETAHFGARQVPLEDKQAWLTTYFTAWRAATT